MLFNSIDFAIFFPVVFLLYWLVARWITARNILIILASYLFYGWWDWRFLFLIFISSLVDFIIGRAIYKASGQHAKKLMLFTSLAVNLGFLAYFKYTNFFIETFIDSFRLFGKELEISTLHIILPVGISFYTFQTLSYTIDIYRNRMQPTNDPLAFFAFVAFFPQLVAGPIERASHLLPQFRVRHTFDYQNVKSGMLLILFGLFKKMVIADRISVLVNQVYNNPADYHGMEIVVATIFFAFQIYCDFSGYSDIAIGLARTMGFDLMQNFNKPYFSGSITEFWRRWHISLSTWFRDYVYIPLGGSKKGAFRTYFNLFAVFLVSGLWHGAAMTFVIWGAVHGSIIVLEKALSPIRKRFFALTGLDRPVFANKLFFAGITFTIVCFAWIFFRANSLADAMLLIKNLQYIHIDTLYNGVLWNLGLPRHEFNFSIFAIFGLIFLEMMNKGDRLMQLLRDQGSILRWSVYLFLVIFLIIFGIYGDTTPKEFIYFQF